MAEAAVSVNYGPLSARNDLWCGSTYWTGPDWTRVGKDWQHPGIDTSSVRCYRVRHDGRVTVTGRVYKADVDGGGGDGIRASIRHNARTVWKAEIDGDDSRGLQANVTIDGRRGDSIRFVVHKRGHIFPGGRIHTIVRFALPRQEAGSAIRDAQPAPSHPARRHLWRTGQSVGETALFRTRRGRAKYG